MITALQLNKYLGPRWSLILSADEYRELIEWLDINTGQHGILYGRKVVKAYGT